MTEHQINIESIEIMMNERIERCSGQDPLAGAVVVVRMKGENAYNLETLPALPDGCNPVDFENTLAPADCDEHEGWDEVGSKEEAILTIAQGAFDEWISRGATETPAFTVDGVRVEIMDERQDEPDFS